MTTFNEVVEAADGLSIKEQESLVEILRGRIASRNRETLLREVAEARKEVESGEAKIASVAEIMNEIRNES